MLETRTTPAFVSGVSIPAPLAQGGAQDVVTGDFNKDGKLDLVATTLDHDFMLYLGNGNGTFKSPVQVLYPPGQNAYSAAVADFNHDDNLDVVTCDQNLGYVYVSLGNGDGTFQNVVHYTAVAGASKILITDVDGNGTPDILVSGISSAKVGVLLNQGDGTFLLGTPITTPFGGGDMTLGHFYGNPNRLDLAIDIGSSTNQILLCRSNGDGTFQTGQVVESSVFNVGGMTTADVNKDGKDDLVAAVAGVAQVFLGNGDGTFQAPVSYNAHTPGSYGGQIITADLRHNGKLDLIVANTVTQDISVLLGNGDGTFQPSTNYVLNYATDTVVAADVDGDGNLDVIAGDLYGQDIEFFKGNGNGTLQDSIDYATPGTEGIGFIADGDLNHDGVADLVTTGYRGSSVDVWIGNGDGSYQPPVSYQVGTQPQGLCLADLNNDGNLDIIAADAGDTNASHAIAILLGKHDGTFQPVQFVAGFKGIFDVTAVDMNDDGKMDLAAVSPNDNALSLYYGKGDGTFQNPANYSTDSNPNYVVSADFNGDNKPDLLVTAHGGDGGYIDVELNKGNGTLQIPPSAALYDYSPTNAVAYDLRKNGINDVLYADPNNSFGYFLGNGDGTFQSGQGKASFEGPVFVAVGDFDGDGNADAAVAGSRSGDLTLFKGDGAGNFTQTALYRNVGPSPGSMVATDLNNDGTLDLAVADNGSNYITILRNQSPTSTPIYFLLTAQSTPVGGQPCQFVVTAVGPAGQTIKNYAGTVHFTSNDPNAILPADMMLTNGVGVVTATFNTIGAQYLRAADSTNTKITGTSTDFSITTAGSVLDHFGFTGAPGSPVAGTSFNVTVTAFNSSNQVMAGYLGQIHFSSTDGHALLPADYTFTLADHGTHTFSLTLTTAGTQSVTVGLVGSAGHNVSQSGIAVQAGSLSKLALTTQTSAPSAGSAFNATLSAMDQYGNLITGYRGTVHFSSSDSQALLPANFTFAASDSGTHTFSITLKTAGTESVAVSDVSNANLNSSFNENVAPGSTAALQMTTFPNTVAGAAHSFTITALDAFGNTNVNYAGTISFSSSDIQAGLPASYTFIGADAGAHTFLATLKTAGSQSLTVQDVANHLNIGQSGITVQAGSLSNLALTTQASTASAGSAFNATLSAMDAFDNLITGYTGTVHFTSSDPQALLPANFTFAASDNGAHTFSITLETAGTKSVTVTDVSNANLSSSFNENVTPGSTVALQMTTFPNTVAGAAHSFTITALDAFGNTSINYAGTISFSSSDAQAGLPVTYTFVGADAGTHTFLATLKTAGSQSLTVQDVANHLNVGQSGIAVSAAAASLLQLTGLTGSATAGAVLSFAISASDAFGNPVSAFGDTVHFSSSDLRAALPTDYVFSPTDHGSHSFSVTLKTPGAETLKVTDTSVGSVTSAQGSVLIQAGATAKLVITVTPAALAGAALSPVVNAYDSVDNPTTNYSGTIHFSSTDPKAVLPADYTFLASDHGSKTFSGVVLKTAGAWSLTVTDVANTALTGSQNNIAVSPSSAASLVASNYPTQATAGTAPSITLSMLDAYGNVVTGYAGTVHFTSTDKQATLPADYPFAGADHGVKTMQVTLKTAGTQTVTASAVGTPTLAVTTSPISVSPASVSNLVFLQQPTTGASGTVMKPAVTVQLLDAFGNIATGSTNQVALTPGVSSVTLGGTTSAVASNGIATFSNITVNGSGVGLTLLASTSGVAAVSSAKFNSVLLSNILPVVVASQIYGPRPNASAQEAFVKGIYRTLLGRDADPSGLSHWVQALNSGSARSSIVTAFWNSPENRGREVDAYYQVYLGRSADPGGRSYWVNQLQAGADETAIVLSFLLSAEELSAPNSVFVQRLYQGALGRSASASEVNQWVGQLTQGETRQQVANSFVFSSEAAGVAVDSFYEAYFQRTSDPTGRAFWVGQISGQKATYASLAITLLESDEFFKNASSNVP